MFSKNTLMTSILAIALFSVSACSTTQTQDAQNHAVNQQKQAAPSMPQKPVLPSLEEMAQKEIPSNRQYVESQIVKQDGKTKYFCDKDNKLVQKKTAGGFYRVVLGTTANGDCAVQDFYADSNTKKNEPFIVDAHHSCGKLNSGAYDDAMITYDEKQQIDGIAHYKDGETLNILISDGDGHLMYADFSDKDKTTVTMKVYDYNLLSMVYHNDEIAELTIFGNNGVTTLIRYVNGKGDVANSYVWDKGEKVPFNNQEVLDSLTEI